MKPRKKIIAVLFTLSGKANPSDGFDVLQKRVETLMVPDDTWQFHEMCCSCSQIHFADQVDFRSRQVGAPVDNVKGNPAAPGYGVPIGILMFSDATSTPLSADDGGVSPAMDMG
ncbi:unnamed protein product [Angiostrongylus costaricensis]|uniref:CENP-V/GFA domain-containing protein n=1 Tax=Angiostrongylus costaricensis TaxID=334426 RepID=A0A0R3PUF8_ANGCS|nr:unnamed protein product [Angiostrongylus costaricensis]